MAQRLTALRHLRMHGYSAVVGDDASDVLFSLAKLPALTSWDLKDSEGFDLRPIGAANGLTRLVLSGYSMPPLRDVRLLLLIRFQMSLRWSCGQLRDGLTRLMLSGCYMPPLHDVKGLLAIPYLSDCEGVCSRTSHVRPHLPGDQWVSDACRAMWTSSELCVLMSMNVKARPPAVSARSPHPAEWLLDAAASACGRTIVES